MEQTKARFGYLRFGPGTIPDYKNYKVIPAGIIPGAQYRANERTLKWFVLVSLHLEKVL